MPKVLFLWIALAPVSVVPAVAQAPTPLKADYVATMYTGEVLPGQLDNFKRLAEKIVAAVAKEPGTLVYVWNLRPDQKTYDTIEVYRNSDALMAHGKHVLTEFGKNWLKLESQSHS